MLKQRLVIALLAISICAAAGFLVGASRSHQATAGGPVDPTCVSTLPCIEYDNNSSGPGVRGVSLLGNGVGAQTKFNSTSASNGKAGVFGSDVSSSGIFNSGVRGSSVRGFGVSGTSTSNSGVQGVTIAGSSFVGGVAGSATSASGVAGKATTGIGVLGTGHFAVEGSDNNTGGDNILANGTGGNLFRGNNSANVDVFLVDDSGNTTIGGNVTAGTITAVPSGTNEALVGESATGTVVHAVSLGGAEEFAGDGVGGSNFFVSNGGDVHAHSFTADLAVAQKTSSGPPLATYASEAKAPSIEDFGESTLQAGSAYVRLDPHFSAAMARNVAYLVFITPQGPTRNSLYVTQKTPYGFQVRENYPGQETVAFDYRIVAKPYGAPAPLTQVAHVNRQSRIPIFHKLTLRTTHEPKPGRMSSSQ